MSTYEQKREANVKRNEEMMRSLGMNDDAEALKAAQAQKKQRKKPVRMADLLPSRERSSRNEGKTVKYTYDHSDRALGIAKESKPRGPGTVVWNNSNCFDAKKAEAATTRADAFSAASALPNCVKQLLKSHVSGGFWLQLPSAFCMNMPDTITEPNPQVMFDLEGCNGDGLPEEVPDGDVWEAIWLPKGSYPGGGLSGGWRGFSLDNNLAVGDTIVFEKLEGYRLRGTIFRALPLAENEDYLARDPGEVEKAAKEQAEMKATTGKRRLAGAPAAPRPQPAGICARTSTELYGWLRSIEHIVVAVVVEQ